MGAGKWSGSVTDPSGNTRPVTFSVTGTGDSLTITLSDTPGGSPVSFANIRQAGDTLLFDWAGGPRGAQITCQLVRQEDGAYEGSCADPEGSRGRMRMIPPPKQ
jgi:hypothetical protein